MKNLNIEYKRVVQGALSISAPKRKDGTLVLRLRLTSIVEDDEVGDVRLTRTLRPAMDQAIKVRKDATSAAAEVRAFTKFRNPDVRKLRVFSVIDRQSGEEPLGELDCALKSVEVVAGSRHLKQIAVIDCWSNKGSNLAFLLELQGDDVAVRLVPLQQDLLDADPDDLPPEPGEETPSGEQEELELASPPAPAKRAKRSTGDVEVGDA